MNDISTADDIRKMVDEFYEEVKNDNLLGPIFEKVVQGNWDPHLQKMYNFWETVLLNVNRYTGSPFQKHIKLDISKPHFDRWLRLFHATIDSNFDGAKAEEAKNRSTQMGIMFEHKLKHIKG